MKNILIIFFAVFLFSCDSDKEGKRDTSLLPKASGSPGELILVMDSSLYSDTVGKALRSVLRAEMVGLPREEPYFTMSQIEPGRMNNVLRTVRNLVFVMTLDNQSPGNKRVRQYFTKSSLERINKEPDLFMFADNDVYARGQKVLYLFSRSSENLTEKIIDNSEQIRNVFNTVERERLAEGLFKSKVLSGLSEILVDKHDFYVKIPFAYKVVENEKGFVWFRQMNDDNDKNIFVTYRPYFSEKQFTKEQIIALRDSIARQKLFEDPALPNTHLVTETGVPFKPVVTKEVNLNGLYAVETRGLWRTKQATMGGPFLSYTVVDENLGRLYYIEGFLYSPGKAQRELMRELEVVLRTFEPRSE